MMTTALKLLKEPVILSMKALSKFCRDVELDQESRESLAQIEWLQSCALDLVLATECIHLKVVAESESFNPHHLIQKVCRQQEHMHYD